MKPWGYSALVGCALMLAGCSGGATAAPSPTATAKPTTYYGETASALAALIPGCSDVKAGNVGKGGPGLTSTASCVLGGRTIDVNSWADATAADMVPLLKANGAELYYATGTGWTANIRRDATLQMQLTNDASGLVAAAGAPTAAADLPGEKQAATAIASALGGTVQHFLP